MGWPQQCYYELYNEPLNRSWDNELKPYAEFVGGKIRAIDPDNLIIMGTPNWTQIGRAHV